MSSLHEAARIGDLKSLLAHLKIRPKINQPYGLFGNTALMLSATRDAECVHALLERKAKVDQTDSVSNTALICCAQNCDRGVRVHIMQALLDAGAKINHKGRHGWTALMYCARANDWKCVHLLLSRGADLAIQSDAMIWDFPRGSTALDIARQALAVQSRYLLQNTLDVVWSCETHRHFAAASKACVTLLLALHRTTVSLERKLKSCHQDRQNRFWKLPKPLLYLIVSFALSKARVVPSLPPSVSTDSSS